MCARAKLAAQEKIHDGSDSLHHPAQVVDEAVRILALFLNDKPDLSCSCFQMVQPNTLSQRRRQVGRDFSELSSDCHCADVELP